MSIRNQSAAGRGLLPLALALLLAGAAPALAQSEPTPMQQLFGALGLLELPKDPIEYRERAPLVVPPSTSLIPPRSQEDIARHNPDWPVDQDVRRPPTAAEIEAAKASDEAFYSGRGLTLDELRRGRISRQAAERRAGVPAEESPFDSGRLSPDQLGFKGWGKKKEEQVVFTGEPERRWLTDPPPGLRTPSTDAPYGVVSSSRGGTAKRDPFDRGFDEMQGR